MVLKYSLRVQVYLYLFHSLSAKNEYFVQMLSPEGERIALEKIHFTYNSPTVSHLAKSLNRGNVNIPIIALTFDGGSLNNIGDEILDYLRELEIKMPIPAATLRVPKIAAKVNV